MSLSSQVQHYIVVMQLPIVSLLIIFSFQASKAFAETTFKIIAWAWVTNLVYLVFGHASRHQDDEVFGRLADVLPATEIARISNVVTIFLFLVAAHHFFSVRRPELLLARLRTGSLAAITLPILLLEILRSRVPSDLRTPFHLPAVVLASAAVFAVAIVFDDTLQSHESRQYSISRLSLVIGASLYALIQIFALAPGEWSEVVGFTIGFVCKTAMVVGLVGGFVMAAQTAARTENIRRRLGEVARTVGRITHELGTPIRLLDNQVTTLRRAAPSHGEFATHLAALENTVLRIDSVIDATLTLLPSPDTLVDVGLLASDPESALRERNVENTNINTLVQLALMAVKETRGEKVIIRTSYSGRCCIHCVPFEIVQIFINLLRNAYDAMPQGTRGHVFVATRGVDADHVQVTVTDDGHGISPELQSEIFSDGVTTRHGLGRGYGMGIVRQLAANNAGTVMIESPAQNRSGRPGTVVTVTLPRVKCLSKEERLDIGKISSPRNRRR